jgi:hypothetical protein
MARIFVNDTWYEQVEPSTFSETEFEDRIRLHAPSIYPHYFVVPFKKTLTTTDPNSSEPLGSSKVIPDLAFIARNYQEWWVVEVEMTYHNFDGHILPQIRKLQNANYGDDEAEYLKRKDTSLDLEKLRHLITTSPSQILLIMNQNKVDWIRRLQNDNVVIAIFELFRASNELEIFRVNGEYPSQLIEKVSDCIVHLIPRLLKVSNPDRLTSSGTIVRLLYNDCLTEWRKIVEGKDVYITAVNRNPLRGREGKKYEIYIRNDEQLVLKQNVNSEKEEDDDN